MCSYKPSIQHAWRGLLEYILRQLFHSPYHTGLGDPGLRCTAVLRKHEVSERRIGKLLRVAGPSQKHKNA